MVTEHIKIKETIEKARQALLAEEKLSPSLRALFKMLIVIIELLLGRLGLNSSNSSKPPSSDPNREKKPRKKSDKKAGGQMGHVGTTLEPVENPDEIVTILLDRSALPAGDYTEAGFAARQVMDIVIRREVTEYRAQILLDAHGKQWRAPFPSEVIRPIQYGNNLKAHAVYMSQFQLLPYKRIEDYFRNELLVPLSAGSLVNFNKEAYDLLEDFDHLAKQQLLASRLIHADETSINIDSKRFWIHNASNGLWTYLFPHQNRGTKAMEAIGILPNFTGVLCHDHWASYYTYTRCLHALCNAHHLRELESAKEKNPLWAGAMQALLLEINTATDKAGGVLDEDAILHYQTEYRLIIQNAESECPPPAEPPPGTKKRGKVKRSKERNLLERLRDYETDVLRFMTCDFVPFTNNQGERDQRMTKVQQKISGCFRSIEGATIFCRIRSYLDSCRKHGITATDALHSIFKQRKLPDALTKSQNPPVMIQDAE